jgi:Rrf2 family protein
MLKLSTKGQYGVRAMFELAKHYDKGPLTIKEIARRQGVSVAYLSRKGPGGGYLINRSPNEISVGMILNSLEGPVAIAQCLDPSTKGCKRVDGCVARLLWKSLGEKIEEFLETVSLSDLLNEEIKLSG